MKKGLVIKVGAVLFSSVLVIAFLRNGTQKRVLPVNRVPMFLIGGSRATTQPSTLPATQPAGIIEYLQSLPEIVLPKPEIRLMYSSKSGVFRGDRPNVSDSFHIKPTVPPTTAPTAAKSITTANTVTKTPTVPTTTPSGP